jgi:hypothetical protein
MASVTERLSIEINVTEEHLKSGTFEINPGQRNIIRKNGIVPGKRDEWKPCLKTFFRNIGNALPNYTVP